MFIMVKYIISAMRKQEEEAPAEPSDEVKLLTEIRDSLAKWIEPTEGKSFP